MILLSDPDCATHRAFGVPRIDFRLTLNLEEWNGRDVRSLSFFEKLLQLCRATAAGSVLALR
jgi:hypothetical protein